LGSFNELLKTDKDALTILKDAQNPIYKSNTDQGKAINLFNSIWIPLQETNKGLNLGSLFVKLIK
jgi:endothelin-converting enzyme/putative endopeptidase